MQFLYSKFKALPFVLAALFLTAMGPVACGKTPSTTPPAEPAADSAPAVQSTGPKLLVVGDSLSAGFGIDMTDSWVTLLEAKLQQEGYGYQVVNASITGDTTGNGRKRLPRALDLHQPEIVILELGGNDGLRGYPILVMRKNLQFMIEQAEAAGALVVLAGMLIPPNYGEDYAKEFAAVYPDLAADFDLPLIPFFMEGVALKPEFMQADGIHPNAAAQAILVETVWKTLAPALADLPTN